MLIRKPVAVAMMALMSIAGNVWAAGDAERGQDLINDCIECQGQAGMGSFETPQIAGLTEAYIVKQLKEFHSGKRESLDGIMNLYTSERSAQDLEDLAAYWATVKPTKASSD